MSFVPLSIRVVAALYLATMMFALGLELGGARESKAEKRVKRRVLIRGLVLNLVVLPAIVFGITRILHASGDVTIALVLLVAAPGGRFAPHLVRFAGGNTALGVELALVLAKVTVFTAVPFADWMLRLHQVDVRELPFLLQLLLLQLLPFYLGKWVRRSRSSVADRLVRPAGGIALLSMLVCMAFVVIDNRNNLAGILEWRGWAAVACVGVLSTLLGWLFAGSKTADRKALAVGVNCRELALALEISIQAFSGRAVHTALFAVWFVWSAASLLLALCIRLWVTQGHALSGQVGPVLRHRRL